MISLWLTAALADPTVSVAGSEDFEIRCEAFGWGDNGVLQQTDYAEVESALSLQRGSDVAFVAYLDYTSNPLVSSTGNVADRVYGAFEVQVKPTDAWTIKAFAGAYKAGIRCSGGQCRQLPGFEGARLALTGSF